MTRVFRWAGFALMLYAVMQMEAGKVGAVQLWQSLFGFVVFMMGFLKEMEKK